MTTPVPPDARDPRTPPDDSAREVPERPAAHAAPGPYPPVASEPPSPPPPAPTAPPTAPPTTPPTAPPAGPPATQGEVRETTVAQPARRGFSGHLLATLLGLVLVPIGVGLMVAGRVQIVPEIPDGSLGQLWPIVLLILGVIVLTAVLGLGLWSPATPIAGGILAGALGAAFVIAPGPSLDVTENVFGATLDEVSNGRLLETLITGEYLLVGALLLCGGVAIAVARRRGRHQGRIRERGRASTRQAEAPEA